MSLYLLVYLIGVVAVSVVSMFTLEVQRQTRKEVKSSDFNDPGASVVGGAAIGAAWPVIAGAGVVVALVGGIYYLIAGKMLKGTVSLVLRKARVDTPEPTVIEDY